MNINNIHKKICRSIKEDLYNDVRFNTVFTLEFIDINHYIQDEIKDNDAV
jgi:hypothetical protein